MIGQFRETCTWNCRSADILLYKRDLYNGQGSPCPHRLINKNAPQDMAMDAAN